MINLYLNFKVHQDLMKRNPILDKRWAEMDTSFDCREMNFCRNPSPFSLTLLMIIGRTVSETIHLFVTNLMFLNQFEGEL